MVKGRKHHNTKTTINKGFPSGASKPSKITASTPYGVCGERLSPFAGLLALIKFLDLMGFEEDIPQFDALGRYFRQVEACGFRRN